MAGDRLRRGIAAGGNWIVDRVKTVDRLPGRGMLANISAEALSTGGGPANVLADLARMRAPFPLWGLGVIGDDADGRFVRSAIEPLGVDLQNLRVLEGVRTSYTDVMSEASTGVRSFFHHRGANAVFAPEHVPVGELECRIFHLAYLLLLDAMDAPDAGYGTRAARLLRDIRERGIETSLDVVSEDSDRFKDVVPPALRFADYLIINEVEAARIVGVAVRDGSERLVPEALREIMDRLWALGSMRTAAIHMPEGAYVRDAAGCEAAVGSLELPEGFIGASVGAGDAFCAGMLLGLHEGLALDACARLGNRCAAASLSRAGASEGVGPLKQVQELGAAFRERPAPLPV